MKEEKVFDYIRKSRTYHGILKDSHPLLIYPDTVFRRLAKKNQRYIAELIKEDELRLAADVKEATGKT